jgi:hypothetical protein
MEFKSWLRNLRSFEILKFRFVGGKMANNLLAAYSVLNPMLAATQLALYLDF